MSRISATFEKLRAANKKALIPFITAGDPNAQMTTAIMHGLVGAGADIIELGVPFLGEVPINIAIRERGDAGETSANLSDEETGRYFQAIAGQMVQSILRHKASQPSGSLPVL